MLPLGQARGLAAPRRISVRLWAQDMELESHDAAAPLAIPVSARTRGRGTQIDVPSYTAEGHPWDRTPTESSAAYEAFCLFRDMGLERTVVAVGREIDVEKSAHTWSAKFNWLARAMAYDDYLEAEKRKAFEAESRAMAVRQAKLGMKMQGVAEGGLDAIEVEKLTPQDIARLADTGVKIERLARGDSTENSGQVIAVRWEGPMPAWASGSALAGVSAATPRLPQPSPNAHAPEEEGQPQAGEAKP